MNQLSSLNGRDLYYMERLLMNTYDQDLWKVEMQ